MEPKNRDEIQLQPSPPWIELPRDVTANILQRLGAECILESAWKVCTTWSKVCQDPAMWRVVSLRYGDSCESEEAIRNGYDSQDAFHGMCRRVVDWSRGQLVDLTLENFGEMELISYVAYGAINLKRLTLRGCLEIDGECLTDAVKQLPELEELHLTNMPYVFAPDVKTIGLACPKLKSFSYNGRGHKYLRQNPLDDIDDDSLPHEYARAIGKSMPNLRHLRLFDQLIQNQSLQAILDGCPHLESLDLRQCNDLDLEGDLGKRCREQIKDLRLPSDSASDIQHLVGGPSEWDDDNNSAYDCYDDYEEYDGDWNYQYDSDCNYQYDDYCNPFAREYMGDDDAFNFDPYHDYL